ncbi:twin-arginine translocase TatA/TatE family subunit [Streptomyces violaceus]
MFGLSELAIILIVVIAVIGIKKFPELARSANDRRGGPRTGLLVRPSVPSGAAARPARTRTRH